MRKKSCFSWNLKQFIHEDYISIRFCSNSSKKKRKTIHKPEMNAWPRAAMVAMVAGGRRSFVARQWWSWNKRGLVAQSRSRSWWRLLGSFLHHLLTSFFHTATHFFFLECSICAYNLYLSLIVFIQFFFLFSLK